MGGKRKELVNATELTCLFFRHDYRILKLHIICSRTRSVVMYKSSVYSSGPSLRLLWRRQIVILKIKIKSFRINAAANRNEHILWSGDAITYTICAMFITELPNLYVDRWLAAKRFQIFLLITARIYFSVNAISEF